MGQLCASLPGYLSIALNAVDWCRVEPPVPKVSHTVFPGRDRPIADSGMAQPWCRPGAPEIFTSLAGRVCTTRELTAGSVVDAAPALISQSHTATLAGSGRTTDDNQWLATA